MSNEHNSFILLTSQPMTDWLQDHKFFSWQLIQRKNTIFCNLTRVDWNWSEKEIKRRISRQTCFAAIIKTLIFFWCIFFGLETEWDDWHIFWNFENKFVGQNFFWQIWGNKKVQKKWLTVAEVWHQKSELTSRLVAFVEISWCV